ncbi:hypothetical protein SLEP1_g11942 [Rubroshorea leprosula]|nr:hypothetical protein SLEP1_g11942 [Rubroshorea leprosula]
MSSASNLSEVSDVPLTLSDLGLSPLWEVRARLESEIECERELIKDPNHSPPPTPYNESYEMEEMLSEETLSVGGGEKVVLIGQEEESEVATSMSKESVEEGK